MDFIKRYKYWIGGIGGLVLLVFLLIQMGILSPLLTSQFMFFGLFALIIIGGFIVLRLIQRYY